MFIVPISMEFNRENSERLLWFVKKNSDGTKFILEIFKEIQPTHGTAETYFKIQAFTADGQIECTKSLSEVSSLKIRLLLKLFYGLRWFYRTVGIDPGPDFKLD